MAVELKRESDGRKDHEPERRDDKPLHPRPGGDALSEGGEVLADARTDEEPEQDERPGDAAEVQQGAGVLECLRLDQEVRRERVGAREDEGHSHAPPLSQ